MVMAVDIFIFFIDEQPPRLIRILELKLKFPDSCRLQANASREIKAI
jgi:hypothetical protein